MLKHARLFVLNALALTLVLTSCGGQGGNSGEGSEMISTAEAGLPYSSPELFNSPYSWLVPDDQDFRRLAPNYSRLRPVRPDTAIVITTASAKSGSPERWTGKPEYFHITLADQHDLRFIVGDSTGNGIIVWEFPGVPAGEYTALKDVVPAELNVAVEGHRWVYSYWLADGRFRRRDSLTVNAHAALVPFQSDQEM